MSAQPKRYAITTDDDEKLICHDFIPAAKARGWIIIAAAMGVEQTYYAALAKWLSSQGYAVTTFDYRGMGLSRHRHLRDYRADLFDWAMGDCSAVLEQVRQKAHHLDVYWLGHSFGGQIYPLVDGIEKVKKVITVAAGTGYWKHNAAPLRKKVWWLWFVIVPVLLRTCRYFPGKRLGMVGDLPGPAMHQWRRWCLDPEYCVGAEAPQVRQQFDQVSLPLRSFALSDDEMLSQRNITALFALYGTADKQLVELHPRQTGQRRIGHLGFFRAKFAADLWPDVLLPELVDQ